MSVIKKWVVVTALTATFLSRFTGYQAGSSSSGVCAFVELISIRLHSSSGKAWRRGRKRGQSRIGSSDRSFTAC